MAEPDLTKLISGPAERDAIHVAVVPLTAGERLYSGQKVRLSSTDNTVAFKADYNSTDKAIGYVSVFMEDENGYNKGVEKGERFWCMLMPGTVTGMQHRWSHPAFDAPQVSMEEHELWLRNFCDMWNFDWDQLIDAGTHSRYVVAGGTDLHCSVELGEDHDLFWYHLEGYTGKKFDEEHRDGMGWSCSC